MSTAATRTSRPPECERPALHVPLLVVPLRVGRRPARQRPREGARAPIPPGLGQSQVGKPRAPSAPGHANEGSKNAAPLDAADQSNLARGAGQCVARAYRQSLLVLARAADPATAMHRA